MKIDILTPTNPDFPPAASRLFISDTWSNALGGTPTFNYALYKVANDDAKTETTVASGSVAMTPDQWANWTNQSDQPYIESCVLANLGLVAAQ